MKKNSIELLVALVLFPVIIFASQRHVLVEMLTNSHCPLCPPAHSALSAYSSTSPHAGNIRFIFYHMVFPYSDDPLYNANKTDADARNSYYGSFSSTPVAFFDGSQQANSYNSWAGTLDGLVAVSSPLTIELSGSVDGVMVTISATVTKTDSISAADLVIHFVAVEDVNYQGRNGVSPQLNVMRKMFGSPGGDPISVDVSEPTLVSKTATLDNVTDITKTGVVVFVQSISTKKIFQSEYIPYSSLTTTSVEGITEQTPSSFSLRQNFPNPFNPSTLITYELPKESYVSLTVYDIVGRRTGTLVDRVQSAGTHTARFDAAGLSAGIYFYRLQSNGQSRIKKMVLLQ